MKKKDPLISLLMQEKIVDESTLKTAIDKHEKTGQSLITILKKENLLDEEQLTKIVASTSEIEFVNLAPEMVDPMVAHLVTYEIASQHNVIPIKREGDKLRVAMSSPLNLSVRDQIEMKTGYKVIPVAATPTAIKHAVHYHFDVTNVTKQAIVSMQLEEDHSKSLQHDETEQESTRLGDSPIAKLDEIKAHSVYHYDDSYTETDSSVDGSYLCNVSDSAASADLRQITVSIGYDLNGNSVLDAGEIEATLATLLARRW